LHFNAIAAGEGSSTGLLESIIFSRRLHQAVGTDDMPQPRLSTEKLAFFLCQETVLCLTSQRLFLNQIVARAELDAADPTLASGVVEMAKTLSVAYLYDNQCVPGFSIAIGPAPGSDWRDGKSRHDFVPSHPICAAVARGQDEKVQELIKEGTSISTRDAYGNSLVVIACKYGRLSFAEALVEAFEVEARELLETSHDLGALEWLFAYDGHDRPAVERLARKLVEKGALPSGSVSSSRPPLFWAIDRNDTEYVRLLLELGANPLQGGVWSPLSYAASEMRHEAVNAMAETKVDGLGGMSARYRANSVHPPA
jgi:hypothetical protein